MMRRYGVLFCALSVVIGCSKKPDNAPTESKAEAPPTDVSARLLKGPHASAEAFCEAGGLVECKPDLVNEHEVKLDALGETVATAAVVARAEDGVSWQRITLIGKPGVFYEAGIAQTWREEEGASPYTSIYRAKTEFAPKGFFIVDEVSGILSASEEGGKRYDFERTAYVCAFVPKGVACADFMTETGYSFEESDDGQSAVVVLQAKEGSDEPILTATEMWGASPTDVDLDNLVREGAYRILLP